MKARKYYVKIGAL